MTLKNEKNQTLQITLPESMVQEFDQISKSKGYQTRSQALKDIISKFIEESKC
ncbi:ribbon-helix-helix protein, CopG family [Methanobacterium alkalithermotolerans]|uniref:Ribbon-helix-helix protein, CopG family n=1 Tax=Methanobacterium alkalithermotolerans TaxID=2731220 RepID=A0A8T8K6G5_9EURY|nr:ribbon-helix-helix domain-containing protein [Methanobacterium alkalithermotolerans]QUH22640.1 ribbon-helix-helix protein, CopG family [Methanobacterium alkalithermotolerans]